MFRPYTKNLNARNNETHCMKIKKFLKLQLRFLWKIFFRLAPATTQVDIQRIGIGYYVRLFFIQRFLRINSHVPWPCHWSSVVSCPANIHMKTFPPYPGLGPGQYIQAFNKIYIGRNVRIGPGVKIISANHSLENFELHDPSEPIYIGDFCWLGANCVILPGVNLGCHVIVGAGAVVTKNFKENNIVIGGVPAKKIKDIGPYKGGLPENVTILKG